MPVPIHGKQYYTVMERVNMLREQKDNYCINTEIIDHEGPNVIMKASILNLEGVVLATGHAEEVRGSTMINKTSALENCETSAIGRALAAFGLGGTEFASANEVENAIAQQSIDNTVKAFRFKKGEKDEVMQKVLEALSVGDEVAIKSVLLDYDSPEAKMAVWALFSSNERAAIKGLLSDA